MYEFNLLDILWERSAVESVDFVEEHLGEALVFSDETKFFHFVIQKILKQKLEGDSHIFRAQDNGNGLYFYFDLNHVPYFKCKPLLRCLLHIDEESFRSLADVWKGNLSVKDIVSDGTSSSDNNDMDSFFMPHASECSSVRFISIEGGTSEVSETILKEFEKHLKPGVLILFGELIGYPHWKNGQYRAWKSIVEVYGFKFRYLGFCNHQALVEIIK